MTHDVPLAPDPTGLPNGATRAATHAATHAATRAAVAQSTGRHQARLLLALATPPVAWTVHLLGAYLIVAAWCTTGRMHAGVAVGLLTVVCAGATVAAGALAMRLWRTGQDALVSDSEPGVPGSWDARMGERSARTVFLAVLALCMAALFAYLIVLEGLPSAFGDTCPAGSRP